MTSDFAFSIHARDGRARTGAIATPRGEIRTPAFMPVGTAATVKAMLPESVRATGADILLGNTYHLMLRPGAERMARVGGLHRFMNWDRPILTNSGGFQVMSLAELRKLTEDGRDVLAAMSTARRTRSRPRRAWKSSGCSGSDIAMAFDECTPHPATVARPRRRCGCRCAGPRGRATRSATGRAMPCSASSKGRSTENLRAESAAALTAIDFHGYAIGGLAVGEGQAEMLRVLDFAPGQLPDAKPRYLMGVGKPSDIVGAVLRGVDMFDCVLPTRSGRTGQALTRRGPVNVKNARHADDPRPLDEACGCPTCRGYSRAYLHHVFKAGEIIASMLLTWHNLHYYQELMAGLRAAIRAGELDAFARAFEAAWPKAICRRSDAASRELSSRAVAPCATGKQGAGWGSP